ncbi:MAG: peptide chain release factor N(5)-glutamine methyltransferase [Oleiphilaceae bacterium]|nr:peptide chain release factor N(5)-glutamine methyltransferase [Oleiphilaceae bacterium]
MRIDEALKAAQAISSDTAQLDASLLLASVLGVSTGYLRTWPERELDATQRERYLQLIERRGQGEPVAHLLGKQGFWTLDLAVSPHTLIPRPDTELLVEQALQLKLPAQARVLDLGTGTGAIALALASERPSWQIWAVDSVPDAVLLAQQNAKDCAIANVQVMQSDWFSAMNDQRFDLIVSNPPYIDPDDPHLREGDVRFEPASALISGAGGLADLSHIIAHAQGYLEPEGWLLLEHGYDQGDAVRELFAMHGYQCVSTIQDLGGRDRVSVGQYVPGKEEDRRAGNV